MRHYTTKEFFRQTPNNLLARYFDRRGILSRFDFDALEEAEPDALIEAWSLLPDEQRRAMDAEFQEIFALSDESGFRAIIDEADWHLSAKPAERAALIEHLSSLPGHFDRAMTAYRVDAKTWSGRVALVRALDDTSAIVLAYERRESERKTLRFSNDLLSVGFVHQF